MLVFGMYSIVVVKWDGTKNPPLYDVSINFGWGYYHLILSRYSPKYTWGRSR